MTLVSALRAIRSNGDRSATRAILALAFAALAAALTLLLYSDTVCAQTPEDEIGDSSATAAAESTSAKTDGSSTETHGSSKTAESDETDTSPTAEKPEAVKRAKKLSKPFEPTEKIEAESVISFPANI